MGKPRTVFVCQECGHSALSWIGRCTSCNAWNSLVEERVPDRANERHSARALGRLGDRAGTAGAVSGGARPITEVAASPGGEVRLRVGIGELDRVLGGGLVAGSLTLVGGDPGVGKSTLLLLAANAFARRGIPVLYVSGEESARQVALRAERLGVLCPDLQVLADTGMDTVVAACDALAPRLLILDSVQTLHVPELDSVPGSLAQVREVGARAMHLAKSRDLSTFLVGHVTKDGALAGPRTLEHLVDTVLYVEGDGSTPVRVVRATKNRFGSTGEIGLFEMREQGLVEVPDASARLLGERLPDAPGTVVSCAIVGARPLLVEVQALVGHPTPATPARTVIGFDRGRLAMILAVLGRAGLALADRDVFVSVAGGLRVDEPAADLAVAVALASSVRGLPLGAGVAVIGEIGLVGEVRGVALPDARVREAVRHGIRRIWLPHGPQSTVSGAVLHPVRRVADVLGLVAPASAATPSWPGSE